MYINISKNKAPLSMLFTGQGQQYIGMGEVLYKSVPFFKSCLDECFAITDKYIDIPLSDILWGNHSLKLNF